MSSLYELNKAFRKGICPPEFLYDDLPFPELEPEEPKVVELPPIKKSDDNINVTVSTTSKQCDCELSGEQQ